jgi:sugar lactone lactonase YvrE
LAVDGAGNLYIADQNVVRKVSPDGIIDTVAGCCGPSNPSPGSSSPTSDCVAGVSGDGGPATQAPLCYVNSVIVDQAGNLFLIEWIGTDLEDSDTVAVRKVSPDGIITTQVGVAAGIYWGGQEAVDRAGNLLIADGGRVLKVSPHGIMTAAAGVGACCYSGDGGPAAIAQLNAPHGVGADAVGDLFIADTLNHRIRRVSPDGIITTVAGNGLFSVRCPELAGKGGPATRVELCNPSNIAVDAAGNVFVADSDRVRKVSLDGRITLVAGNGVSGYSGDGGPASEAQLTYAGAVAVDASGNLFVQDFFRIRRVSPDGIITTVAGNGTYGFSGDGGPAIEAQMTASYSGLAVDTAGYLYFVDSARIRKVSPNGIITTVAGNGTFVGPSGDGGPAASAQISPHGVAVDRAGNLFIAEGTRVRKVSTNGIITTIVGPEASGSPDSWYATSVAVDAAGNVYVSGNNIVLTLRPIQ